MNKWERANTTPDRPLIENEDGSFSRITACEAHIETSRKAAREGMVLLKNENNVLPLKHGSKVALLGKGTIDYVKGGGGSGDVTTPWVHNIYDGFKCMCETAEEDFSVFEPAVDFYKEYVYAQYAAGAPAGLLAEPFLPEELLKDAAAFADTAIISISRFSGEGWDRRAKAGDEGKSCIDHWCAKDFNRYNEVFITGDYNLTDAEQELITRAKEAFKHVVIVLNIGSIIDSSWFKNDPRIESVLLAWQGGMDGGTAAAQLLVGIDNPSGKLCDTMAASIDDYPSTEGFYESDTHVEYTDDIYVGYRYFETIPGAAEKVNYPFGYGLSYTTFEVKSLSTRFNGDFFNFDVKVTNTGNYPGREVVQLYYSAPQGLLGKPARVLGAYHKSRLLLPGRSQTFTLKLSPVYMASFDDTGKIAKSSYVLEKGDYNFYIGSNVRNAEKTEFIFRLPEDAVLQTLPSRLAPSKLTKRLRADGSYEAVPASEYASRVNVLGDKELGKPAELFPTARKTLELAEGKPQLIDVFEGRITLAEFVSALSDKALAYLLSGTPNTGIANTFGHGNLPEYGVPNIMTADGPAGIRFRPEAGVHTTAFPCATLLACTWDERIMLDVGRAAGYEAQENNIGIWLAPAVNIHRSPLCGRNFEYYSEDPYLAAKQASALVMGVQYTKTSVCVKHFALNNKETNRRLCDSRCSERAIREIYLRQFELIVKEAKPWSIMTSYNIINGVKASENTELLNGILREEWGYDGMVTTDWWTLGEHYLECKAGNDIKMGCGYPDRLLAALEKGVLTRSEMEAAGKNILGLILKMD